MADNTNYDIFYALKQIILVRNLFALNNLIKVNTKYNTFFAIDSKHGEILWKYFFLSNLLIIRQNLNTLIESSYQLKGIYSLEYPFYTFYNVNNCF